MYDYNLLEERDILCIDQKSFFASVSCIQKGLNPLETKLAVVADTKRQGSVVLGQDYSRFRIVMIFILSILA